MERSYYADNLVAFAKQDKEKSTSGKYLLIGYFNTDKSKFRDVATGEIYPVENGAEIQIGVEKFIQTEIEIKNHVGVNNNRYLSFSSDCVFTKIIREPFAEAGAGIGYPYLYHFVEKHNATKKGVITNISAFRATKEAEHFAEKWLASWEERTSGTNDYTAKNHCPGVTEEEREF